MSAGNVGTLTTAIILPSIGMLCCLALYPVLTHLLLRGLVAVNYLAGVVATPQV